MTAREIAEKLAHDLDLDERLSVRLYNTAVIWFTTALEEREREGYALAIEDALFTIEEGPPHAIYRNIRALAHKARGEKGDV